MCRVWASGVWAILVFLQLPVERSVIRSLAVFRRIFLGLPLHRYPSFGAHAVDWQTGWSGVSLDVDVEYLHLLYVPNCHGATAPNPNIMEPPVRVRITTECN